MEAGKSKTFLEMITRGLGKNGAEKETPEEKENRRIAENIARLEKQLAALQVKQLAAFNEEQLAQPSQEQIATQIAFDRRVSSGEDGFEKAF